MKNSRTPSTRIARKLAAVEREIAQVRETLRVLDARRERLRTAQSVLMELQSQKQDQSPTPSCTEAAPRKSGGPRPFHSEGQTSGLVRYLYAKSNGSAVLEAARHTGVPAHRTRVAFERLCASGLMIRSGKQYALTTKGIAAWQESPLFGREEYRQSDPSRNAMIPTNEQNSAIQ